MVKVSKFYFIYLFLVLFIISETFSQKLFNDKELDSIPRCYSLNQALKAPAKVYRLEIMRSENTKEFSKNMTKLISLQELDMTTVPIKDAFDLSILKYLQRLFISATKTKEVPHYLKNMNQLKVLHIYANKISTLPQFLLNETIIEELDMHEQYVDKFILPDSIKNDNMRELNLKNNKIRQIPEGFFGFKSLLKLNLSNCQLTRLPSTISNITSIQELDLSNNPITILPDSMSKLVNIRNINLSNTNLTKIPEWIFDLNSLQRLDISNTPMNYSLEEKMAIDEKLSSKNSVIRINW